MSAFRVTCPQCNKRLVLKDRSLQGRKGKCPKCGHRFVLSERVSEKPTSEALQIELVESPPLGIAAEYVPDDPPGVPPTVAMSDQPAGVPHIDLQLSAEDAAPYRRPGRRSHGRGRTWIGSGLVLAICGLAGAAVYVMTRVQDRPPLRARSGSNIARVPEQGTTSPPLSKTQHAATDNEPIRLLMVPSGARLIVNLRPAELWSDDEHLTELRASLTEEVVASITQFLQDVAHREPQQIEEVLLAWILGARGTAPQLAAVVHLANEERLSDLIDEFGGEPLDELAQPKVYHHGEQAVLIHDRRTLAFAPREFANDLADWVDVPNLNTSDGMLALLEQTDRRRLVTIVCEPADVSRHLEILFPEAAHDVARLVTSWFAEQAETVAWSIGTGNEFRSEILLRGPSTVSASTLEQQVITQMQSVPPAMMESVSRMRPARSGFRKLIGRFPAMLEVFRRATASSLDGRAVRLVTVLPPQAGPNLTLASVLTWAESTRSLSADRSASRDASAKSPPRTIAERLALPVAAEFNRTPLQEAIDYIAGEVDLPIEIDGDALKDAGYTKNMPQTYTLGTIPAKNALRQIVGQYQEEGKEIVLVVDEQAGRAVLTTRKFAVAAGQTPFDLTVE